MATMQSATVSLDIQGTVIGDIGIAAPRYIPRLNATKTFAAGVANHDQLDVVGSCKLPLTGAAQDVDMAGVDLVDADNQPIDPAEVVAFVIHNPSAFEALAWDTTVANGWQAAVNGSGSLPPGGFLVIYAPDGWALTAGTGDIVQLTGTNGEQAHILALGRSSAA